MPNISPQPLRILYAAGPGDIISAYNHWKQGQSDPFEVTVTYSGQFYDVCTAINAEAWVISRSEEKCLLLDGAFKLERRPMPLAKASGVLYHLGMIWYGIRLILSAIRFKAKVAVVQEGTTDWFVLSLLTFLGVQVIPSIHCVLWTTYAPQRQTEKFILGLNRTFFSRHCRAILTASEDISEQISKLTHGIHSPTVTFLPSYRRNDFADIPKPNTSRSPFQVLFVGRIIAEKGVFDLLEVAKRLIEEGRHDFQFHLCGQGPALEALQAAASAAKVGSFFICHGHCYRPKMQAMFSQAHIVIVPTRTTFIEGFNQVVAEGVLSARPVITSKVCPALSYVRDGVVEVPPNDVQAYKDALLKLCDDRAFYEAKHLNCIKLQDQFYDVSKSWGATLKAVLTAL